MRMTNSVVFVIALVCLFVSSVIAGNTNQSGTGTVTYDGRSLIINGKRELLFSGSIHYPRSTPDMWPDLITKAKEGGLNTIATYTFWNAHEPFPGEFNFEGNFDLVKFVKLIHEQGLYCLLRVGPYIQAEYNHGGLPYWLREVPHIAFRTDNTAWKFYAERYIRVIVDMLKKEKLFYPQGGPIIMGQIENEYNTIQKALGWMGDDYVKWNAKLAENLDTGVPWLMCKQWDAPDPLINSCNGRHCADTFPGPNKPNKPALWSENWTAQFRVFGDPPSQRSAEDISYAVAKWFAKNGALVNYYMYHGGTNLGRTAASFMTTRYYDEAPLDEYGLTRGPKWGHLRDLHAALNLCKKALLWGHPVVEKQESNLEIRVYENSKTQVCAAFLINNGSDEQVTTKFRGQEYTVPPRSVSILPDCKTVVYNSLRIVSEHNSRKFVPSKLANKQFKWMMFSETVPQNLQKISVLPNEIWNMTKDTTDYVWYSTSIKLQSWDMSMRKDVCPVLSIRSTGHGLIAFVNGRMIGSGHGSHITHTFGIDAAAPDFKPGLNTITLLGYHVGMSDSGANLHHKALGPNGIQILGLNTGKLDAAANGWGYKVGMDGENMKLFTAEGLKRVEWKPVDETKDAPPVTWFRTYFDAPEGNQPVVVRMTGMNKGTIWINGNSIGRYWVSYLSPLLQPTQADYHIPRSYLKPKDNLMVVFEEEPANPRKIQFLTVNRDTICSIITEEHPPNVRSWARTDSKIQPVVNEAKSQARIRCTGQKKISVVEFASFGDPTGICGALAHGNCTSSLSKKVVEQNCLGKSSCDVPIERSLFDDKNDKCPHIMKTLAIQVICS